LKSLPLACEGNGACEQAIKAIQVAYVFSVMVGWPLIVVPPVKISEKWLFAKERRSGQKWAKNAWRSFLVVLCFVISVRSAPAGARDQIGGQHVFVDELDRAHDPRIEKSRAG